MDPTPGMLALVGGGEWQPGCSFDAEFLAASGSDEVLVLPTAAAYEHPERLVVRAGEWFAPARGQGGRADGPVPGGRRGRGVAAVMREPGSSTWPAARPCTCAAC